MSKRKVSEIDAELAWYQETRREAVKRYENHVRLCASCPEPHDRLATIYQMAATGLRAKILGLQKELEKATKRENPFKSPKT